MKLLLDLDVEEAELLGEVGGVLLALSGGLLGEVLVGGDKVGGGRLELGLEDADDNVAHAEVARGNAGLKDPDPGLLVGLDLVAVAHLLKEVHHGAELGLVVDGGGLLGSGGEDLLEGGVVSGQIRGAVADVHVDEELAGLIVVLAGLDLLDPGGGVGVDLVAEEIVLLGSRRLEAESAGGAGEGSGGEAAHNY